MPVKINFKLYQGSTFNEVLRWESSTKVYKPITGITKSAPVEITSIGHSVPEGWRVKVTDVVGMKQINNTETYYQVSNITSDTFNINSINAVSYTDYISGGIVEYNQPIDLAGYTARMQLRSSLDSEVIILELTTENSRITIDNVTKTITLNISATDTAALDFSTVVYSLELESSTGVVTPFANGNITLVKEVTR